MTLKSKSDVTERVPQELDQIELSESVRQDLSQARMRAMARLQQQSSPSNRGLDKLRQQFNSGFYWTSAPVAVAIAVAILLSYQSIETLPELPGGMLTAEVPVEDLAMLEDLEFADWLSRQEEVLN